MLRRQVQGESRNNSIGGNIKPSHSTAFEGVNTPRDKILEKIIQIK